MAPIGSHVNENEKNSLKFKISKIRESNFVRILETKIQEKFQKIRERFVGGVARFAILAPIGSRVNEKIVNI